ncbi:hypothetical protein [Mesorhizobium sp. CAU 1732]|uniref:hypothetical protein n=1 Tax=Mesorhizobium sp. CAU 1732 TaxID=3140358 RepID=UPI003260DED8
MPFRLLPLLIPLCLIAACTTRTGAPPRAVVAVEEPLPAGITPLTVEQDEMLRR